jgi:hypothetical protein
MNFTHALTSALPVLLLFLSALPAQAKAPKVKVEDMLHMRVYITAAPPATSPEGFIDGDDKWVRDSHHRDGLGEQHIPVDRGPVAGGIPPDENGGGVVTTIQLVLDALRRGEVTLAEARAAVHAWLRS